MIKPIFLLGLFLIGAQTPKNDPNGVWQADSGTKFSFRLTGSDLKVQVVEGSNPRYLKYEMNLKNQEEVNTYVGSGYFIAKLQDGKECRFDTEWQIVVVQPDRIVASATNIVPVPGTCDIAEKTSVRVDLRKVN
jgi:hypothetical protein